MDLNQAKKLAKDKIISDQVTRLVRRSIKRKERQKQQAREGFREEFGELLDSQDLSNQTQKLILEELCNINDENIDVKPPKKLRRLKPKRPSVVADSSDEEVSSDEADIPEQRFRLPGLLYRGAQNIGNRIYNRLYPPEDKAQKEIEDYQANLQRRQKILDSQQQLIDKEDEILQREQQLIQQRQRIADLQQDLFNRAQIPNQVAAVQIPDIPVQNTIAQQRDNLRNMWENLEKQKVAGEKAQNERKELADLQEEMLRQAQDLQASQKETGQSQLQRIRELNQEMINNYQRSINQQNQQNQEMQNLEKMFGEIKDKEKASAQKQRQELQNLNQMMQNAIQRQRETQQNQQLYQQQIADAQTQLQNQTRQLQAMQSTPQRVVIDPEPVLSALRQQLSQAQYQTQSLRDQLEQTKQLRSRQQDLARQIEKEQQEQQNISKQIENQSAVEDITEAIGDLTSSAVSAMGKVASSGVDAIGKTASTLFVQPLKAIGKAAKSATVKSVDIFPPRQTMVTSSDIFPSQPSQLRSSRFLEDRPPQTIQEQMNRQQTTQVQMVSPARAGLRTSRMFDLDDSGDETDTGYTTAPAGYETDTPAPRSRLSSRMPTPTGEDFPRQAQNIAPLAMEQPPQYKTSYYTYEPVKSTVQEPIPRHEELSSMSLEELKDLNNRITKSNRSISAMISGKERKRNKTAEDYRLLQEYQRYKNELNAYLPYFREHLRERKKRGYGMKNTSIQKYIFNLHKLRNSGVISNTKLNKILSSIMIK